MNTVMSGETQATFIPATISLPFVNAVNWTDRVHRIETPAGPARLAEVIKGARSKRFMPDMLAEVRARAPQVQMAEVPASDHHITPDNPRGFIEVVREFLHT